MKGLHQQSSLLSALSKHNLLPTEMIDEISSSFIQQKKPIVRYLVEDKEAEYLFTVKGNQKTLRQDIKDLNLNSFPPSTRNY